MSNAPQRSRRHHPRTGVSWTVWIRTGERRVRHHTVDISTHGAKLRPRGPFRPGTPVQLQIHPHEGRPMRVSGVVWRVDTDGFVVLFLGGLPQHLTAASEAVAAR